MSLSLEEAIDIILINYPPKNMELLREAIDLAVNALRYQMFIEREK